MLKREMRSLRGLPSTQLNRICLAVSVAWGCMSVAGLLAVVTEGRLGRSWVGGAYQDMSNCRCILHVRHRPRTIPLNPEWQLCAPQIGISVGQAVPQKRTSFGANASAEVRSTRLLLGLL